MIPNPASVPEHVREEKLGHRWIAIEQYTCTRDWMATQFTVVAIVFPPERTLSGFAKLGGTEERLTLSAVAAEPPLAVSLSRCHRPG